MPRSAVLSPSAEALALLADLPSYNAGSDNIPGRAFRAALGRFATGVTVLTTRTPEGRPIGVTISSFNSVSLEPPLILWSLSRHSPKLVIFRQASHYAVNVLAADQAVVSDRFAAADADPFDGLRVREGLGGVPLLEGCSAWFECRPEAEYPGGDHLIFVGRVHGFAQGEAKLPLIFHDSTYRELNEDLVKS